MLTVLYVEFIMLKIVPFIHCYTNDLNNSSPILYPPGIGGSGRQSAARLAAFMADFELFQIEITKNYSFSDWREDIRKMMRRAGEDGVSMVTIYVDLKQ